MKDMFRIAELPVRMIPRYEPLLTQSIPYRWDGQNEDVIADLTVTEADYKAYHRRYPEAEDSLIEYMATGSSFYKELIRHQGFLLHASAVILDGKAYLFSAPSGTGKSTHTSLWLKEFKDAQILNDDKPAIRILEDGIFVYGTPWSGKTDLNLNCKVPLQGIAFLSRGENNTITKMEPLKALEQLLNQTIRPGEKEYASTLLDHISVLIKRVPIYSLTCNMDPSAAHLSYETMSKGEVK